MERVCFVMQVRPDRITEYLAAHETVWPEMLQALRDAGWRDYSLFVDRETGLVVGTLETDDFAEARRRMDATDVNLRWQATMAPFFVTPDGAGPDRSLRRLEQYFHLV
ncbi:L-rhamnose mutarotase [Nakamurella endophytica]|uniref:L-rhamnose mutarotase n=1 Tax=Nakamurella endophytica TaxID=1748367 RepID=A0A917WCQ6_9ACTN|nr:L-rhamnose mutarotase [Nakamurella endophytica]GGL95008.1 L-rhamnose mutarotase [Nakamurella endophytica]